MYQESRSINLCIFRTTTVCLLMSSALLDGSFQNVRLLHRTQSTINTYEVGEEVYKHMLYATWNTESACKLDNFTGNGLKFGDIFTAWA